MEETFKCEKNADVRIREISHGGVHVFLYEDRCHSRETLEGLGETAPPVHEEARGGVWAFTRTLIVLPVTVSCLQQIPEGTVSLGRGQLLRNGCYIRPQCSPPK